MKKLYSVAILSLLLSSCQTVYILEDSDMDQEADNDPAIISVDHEDYKAPKGTIETEE